MTTLSIVNYWCFIHIGLALSFNCLMNYILLKSNPLQNEMHLVKLKRWFLILSGVWEKYKIVVGFCCVTKFTNILLMCILNFVILHTSVIEDACVEAFLV